MLIKREFNYNLYNIIGKHISHILLLHIKGRETLKGI